MRKYRVCRWGQRTAGTRTRRSHTTRTVNHGQYLNSKAMLPHPLLHPLRCFLGPSSAQELPHGLKDTDRRLGVPTAGHVWRLEMVAKTAWHHSSYTMHCLRLVLVTIKLKHAIHYYTASSTCFKKVTLCLRSRD